MTLVAAAPDPSDPASYVEAVVVVQRLHRALLHVVADALDRAGRHDVNPIQALLLHAFDDGEITAGEIITRGYYLGSNGSYNVKKLVAGGFLEQRSGRLDRRMTHIRLTPKGAEIRALVAALYAKRARDIAGAGAIGAPELAILGKLAARLDRFWTDQVIYRL